MIRFRRKVTHTPWLERLPAPWLERLPAPWLERLPELCGVLWLALLAGAIWIHTHATTQAPITDAFTYYQKAYNFWRAIKAGGWFNPLDLEPTFRPPGTVLMSYPFGFDPDPKGFYFRSVYFPSCLLFFSVLILNYRVDDNTTLRWRTILTAVFFTTITLPYHFELDAGAPGFWGLVDSFLTGLAALAAASVWRGTDLGARTWMWAVSAALASVASILVKPSGTFVAAIAGIAWTAFALEALSAYKGSDRGRRSLALHLILGAALIGLADVATVTAALKSRYLSPENLAVGQGAITIMKAELRLPLSQLWWVLNTGLGGALLLWGALTIAACAWVLSSEGSAVWTTRHVAALLASLGAVIFGTWFWFVGSGGATIIRYAVPFFVMGMMWLVPVVMQAWHVTPLLLRRSILGVMIVPALNLILILNVPHPAPVWQWWTGVSVATASLPQETLASFRRLVGTQPPSHPLNVYVMSLDDNDWILASIVYQTALLSGKQSLFMRRPVDWNRPTTFRVAEIAAADTLLINPYQARQMSPGAVVHNFGEEQAAFTDWADKLGASDGVSIFFQGPTAKILSIVDPIKYRASLTELVARYEWDPTFAEANQLSVH
jgi:hypothetical protein